MDQGNQLHTEIMEHFREAMPLPEAGEDRILEFFEKEFEVVELKKNEYLYKANDTDYYFYFIHQGLVRVYQDMADGSFANRLFLHEDVIYVEPTYFMGQMPMINSGQALEDSLVCRVEYKKFDVLTKTDVAFANFLIEELKNIIFKRLQRELMMQSLSLEEYYKYLMKEYADDFHRIPNYHVASYLGVSEVSLSRIRKKIMSD